MGNPVTVTLSSVGTSRAVNLDWLAGTPVSVALTLASTTMTADFTLQYTLDDIQLVVSPSWYGASSAVGSSATHYSSAIADNGAFFTFLTPVAAVRINSTAVSSSSITMRVLQGL